MRHRLRLTIALAALQLFALLPAAADGKAPVLRSKMAQGVKKTVRRRAPDTLMPGMWGGRHIRFEVTENGANIEYDCAHGTVEGKIGVDSQGRFNVYGTHYEERGGPVRLGQEAKGYRVRLNGRVGGSLLKLTVTRAGTRRVVGTFTLARDREPEVFKCR